ncbi:sensor histidine kinase [Thermogemmatispora sp.]|uniref:sensor histidine kinase n=1 Tax=Thermogemmatispora sp. TaxID=1968838 RepID=UPI0035E4197A
MSYGDRPPWHTDEVEPAAEAVALQRELLGLWPALVTAPLSEVAAAMLQVLREGTGAEYGALFLQRYTLAEGRQRAEALQLLALQRSDEERARAVVSLAGSGNPMLATGAAESLPWQSVYTADACWLLLSLPLLAQQAERLSQSRWLLLILLGREGRPQPLARWQEQSGRAIEANQSLLAALIRQALLSELLAGRTLSLPPASTSEGMRGQGAPAGPQGELLATLSHELRSPLAIISASASTLLRHERRLPLTERRQLLEAILEAGERLTLLCNRFLELSELEAGLLHLEPSAVDPASVAREAVLAAEQGLAAEQASLFSFQVVLQDASGAPASGVPPVLADRRRLREVLDHLLENAIRFSPQGGEIRLTLRPRIIPPPTDGAAEQPAPAVEICVSDQGRGMPPEQLSQIFERFYRGSTGLAREAGGLGLGLTLCKYLVELQGGQIWAESEPGQGSRLYLWLPALPAAPTDEGPNQDRTG